ncbi:MAG: FMN-binding negative transcriptional regulator [Carbonactinosporaceae bacterium]
MLIHPWDAALDDTEWRDFLSAGHDFGQLIAAGRGRDIPVVVPTHFVLDRESDGEPDGEPDREPDGAHRIVLHLARPNPVWQAIEENPTVLLAVVGDYTYVPTGWNASPGTPAEAGVPTSYYAAVQLACRAEVVDDPEAKASVLRRQLAHFQPEGGHADVTAGEPPYGRLLSGIRGIVLTVTGARAKFKYGGNKAADHRRVIAGRLAERMGPHDAPARQHLLRRLEAGG